MLGSAKDAVQLIHQAKQASAPTLAFLLYGFHDAHIMPAIRGHSATRRWQPAQAERQRPKAQDPSSRRINWVWYGFGRKGRETLDETFKSMVIYIMYSQDADLPIPSPRPLSNRSKMTGVFFCCLVNPSYAFLKVRLTNGSNRHPIGLDPPAGCLPFASASADLR